MTDSDDIAALLAESANAFLAERYSSRRLRVALEEPQSLNRHLWSEMAGLGWLGITLPEALGGMGMGMREATTLTEIMGRKGVAEPFVAAAVMPGALLSSCDQACAVVQRLASAIATGDALVTIAWQEAAGQLEPRAPLTRLDEGRLSGAKCFVPALEPDSLLLVTARAEAETVLVAVEANGPGVTYERQAGGLMTFGSVCFDAAPALEGAVLLRGASADAALKIALEAGRVAASAQLTGIAAGALEKTVAYVGERIQFERPIGSFQTVQHRCVDYHVATMLAGASWRNAQRAFDADPTAATTARAVSAAKARSGDTALQVCKGSVQLHGAMGFTEEAGLGVYLRAAMQLSAWLGSAPAHRRRFLAAAA